MPAANSKKGMVKNYENSYGTNSGNRTSYYLGKHRNILTPLYYPGNNL